MLRALILTPLALLIGLAPVTAAAVPATEVAPRIAPDGNGWKAKSSDNIAGLSDLKKLSKPSVVDYDDLLAATPEMKEIKRDRIDPESTKGRTLRQQASDRVTKAAEAVRKEKRHCSVWKAITHSDKRKVPDITKAVKAKLESV